MLRAILVDDHATVREGLRQLLERGGELVCSTFATAESAMEVLQQGIEASVVVLDLSLPGMDGWEALARIKAMRPELPVLILSMHPEERYAARALRLGAAGYLSKSTPSTEVVRGVLNVVKGQAGAMAPESQGSQRPIAALHEALSAMELQVVRHLGAGRAMRDTALELGVSDATLSELRQSVLSRLRLGSNLELMRYALREGLLDPQGGRSS